MSRPPPARDMDRPEPKRPTASARAVRRHLAALLAGVVTVAATVGLWGWSLGPPVGDLMRISGGSSREFGWRDEAEGFARDHYVRLGLDGLLAGADPGDILVFGDSFSLMHDGGISWINTLHARTGLSIRYVRIADFDPVLRWLGSEAAHARPPRVVIVQTVERAIAARGGALHDAALPCEAPPGPRDALTLARGAPLELPRQGFQRREIFEGLDELFSWGALAARLRLSGGTQVITVNLIRDDLFSHRIAARLPLIVEDIEAHLPETLAAPPARVAAEMRCGLRRLISAGAGVAPVWLMIAPDKRSVYAPWIADPLPEKALDLFAEAEAAVGPALIDLLGPLRAAAEGGMRDLYWPDDTHWGAAGNRLAGEAAARAITGGATGD